MAYTDITDAGALSFVHIKSTMLNRHSGCVVVTTTANERLTAHPRHGLEPGCWAAVLVRKSNSLSIPYVIDLSPYYIDWCQILDQYQVNELADVMYRLNDGTKMLAEWRQRLSEAEHQALISGTFAALSGVSTVAGGIAVIGDLLSGGIPLASGLWTAASGMAFGCNLGQLEAAAKRGDLCVQNINATNMNLIQLGRQIDLPFCTPHHTPIIQSACTGLANAFGWANGQIEATQAGILSWLNANPRFSS